jgi:hypothetical protein
VGKICFFFFYFILHTAYTVDACATTSIQPSLSLIDTIYCMAETIATPALLQIVGVYFEIDMDSDSPHVVKRVRNRTARFRCVFGSTDAYGVRKNWERLG